MARARQPARAPVKAAARAKAPAAKPSRAVVPAQPRRLAARWDVAQTTKENAKHWAMADGLSADAAANPAVRRVLRNRSRYERDNNSYCDGLVTTLANDCVGTGPRPQMLGVPEKVARFVEREFCEWMCHADVPEKLRTLRAARSIDGEGFAIAITNQALETPVKLDLRLVEAEQVTSPSLLNLTERMVDGIHFDDRQNPLFYDVLRMHPGSSFGFGGFGALQLWDQIPASAMMHFFIPKRPGQRRGVPEITPALPLFAQLRRWTLSVLGAAELAADFAGILHTNYPPSQEADTANPFDAIDIERRMLMTLPAGWDMKQLKAEQPVSTYSEFKHELLSEIARCLQIPFNIAAGNSSNFNYASGRLDHQIYHKSLRVDRARLQAQVLDPLFRAWAREAVLIEGYLDQSLRTDKTDWSHGWFWDGSEHVDPQKEATAQNLRLASMTTTLADEYAKQGKDWTAALEQIAREQAKMRELGITPVSMAPKPRADQPVGQDENGKPTDAAPDGEEDDGAEVAEDTAEARRVSRGGIALPGHRRTNARHPARG